MAAVSAQKERLDDLEKTAEIIRREFEQFFMGLQRRAPTTAQAKLAGMMRKIIEDELVDWATLDRFRFNQIHARFISMERIWARTLKQIEDGTYKREGVHRRNQRKAKEAAAGRISETTIGEAPDLTRQPLSALSNALDSIDLDMGAFDEDSQRSAERARPVLPASMVASAQPGSYRPLGARPVAPGAPVAPVAPMMRTPIAPGATGGPSDQQLQKLYKVYIDAKKRTGESTSLSFDALREQIAKQVPTIRQKHNCEFVDFKVVLREGKAMLKAVPK